MIILYFIKNFWIIVTYALLNSILWYMVFLEIKNKKKSKLLVDIKMYLCDPIVYSINNKILL